MTSPFRVIKSVAPKLVLFLKSVVVYLVLLPENGSFVTAAVKCAPVLSLILFVLLHGVEHHAQYKFSRRILIGLCWSCVGDVLLVWPQHFVWGMAAFGVAQVTYTSAFGFKPLRPLLGAVPYSVAAFVYHLLSPGLPPILNVVVPIYGGLLATTAWRSCARLQTWRWSELCTSVGGVLFFISDGLIGFNMFYAPIANSQVLIMSTYYLAQLCIALSVVDSVTECKKDSDIPNQTCHSTEKVVSKNRLNAA